MGWIALIGALSGVAGLIMQGVQNKKNRESNENTNDKNRESNETINEENIEATAEQNALDRDLQREMNELNAQNVKDTNETNLAINDATNQMNYKIQQETNAQNLAIANQNLEFQKEQQAYEEALQQEMFRREDTAYQRTAADMLKAGISPLAMNGQNGAGAVVGRTVLNNAAVMDSSQMSAATVEAFTGNQATVGKVALRKAYEEQAFKNDMDFMSGLKQISDAAQGLFDNGLAKNRLEIENQNSIQKAIANTIKQESLDETIRHNKAVEDNWAESGKFKNGLLRAVMKRFGISYDDDGALTLGDNSQVGNVINEAKKHLEESWEAGKESIEKLSNSTTSKFDRMSEERGKIRMRNAMYGNGRSGYKGTPINNFKNWWRNRKIGW